MHKTKILITSVGSLVGQNLLDVLDSPIFPRRRLVTVIGCNSIAASPNNFRCDRCYLVPNTASPEFRSELIAILETEQPDLILSGRDEDTETVATIMRDNPHLSGKLPYGRVESLRAALNKWETWRFTQRHSLPFARVFVFGYSGGLAELKDFVETAGYPLIAKPIQGFGSHGVFFVRNWRHAEMVAKLENYLFQEYLGDPESLEAYFEKMDGPTPLFAHAPNIFHHSCHTVIAPDGNIAPIFVSRNEHDSGVTVGFRKVEHPVLESLTLDYARALHEEGGYGPVTVQFRQARDGAWKAQEMNMRTNGNTYPRFLMGQDDLGLIMQGVMPEAEFPIYEAPPDTRGYIIGKSLHSHVMHPEAIDALSQGRKMEASQ